MMYRGVSWAMMNMMKILISDCLKNIFSLSKINIFKKYLYIYIYMSYA